MHKQLEKINKRPLPFEFYTAETLWNDPHISKQMLAFHLDKTSEPASRNHIFIEKSIDWLMKKFSIGPGVKIADFGCGPGLYTTAFAEKGAIVTGIDFSTRSIEHAKQVADEKQLNIDYVQQNYLEFSTSEKFDLITMIYCDFCALSPQQRGILLSNFRDMLADGGSIVMDVFSLNAFNAREENSVFEQNLLHGFWSANDYFGFMKTIKYDNEKVAVDKYTIIEESRTFEVYNWLQYFDYQSLDKEFAENGLKICEKYSDIAGTPAELNSNELAVIVKKA